MTLRTRATLALAAALLGAAPAAAQETVADLDTSVRCAAAFGLVAGLQEQGDADALTYPPLGARGREFFVQVGARLIDERGLSHEELSVFFIDRLTALIEQAQAAPDPAAELRSVVQPCLVLLDATIPAGSLPPPASG